MQYYGTRNWFDQGKRYGYTEDTLDRSVRHAGKNTRSSMWFALGGPHTSPSKEEEYLDMSRTDESVRPSRQNRSVRLLSERFQINDALESSNQSSIFI